MARVDLCLILLEWVIATVLFIWIAYELISDILYTAPPIRGATIILASCLTVSWGVLAFAVTIKLSV